MHEKNSTLVKGCWILALLSFFFFAFWFYPFTMDDSYISFRYSENFIEGHGLTWNVGDDPVEGYSNFLWVLVSDIILKLGLPIEGGIKFVGVILQLANLVLLYKIAEHLTSDKFWSSFIVLLTAITPAFGFWAIGGLENPLFMFFFFGGILFFLKEIEQNSFPYSSIAFTLSAMTRHEGAVLFVLTLVYRISWCFKLEENKLRISKEGMKSWILSATIFGIMYTPYFVWRWQYYGFPFPNTYYAKISPGAGWSAIKSFLNYFWPFLLMAIPSLIKIRSDSVALSPRKGAVYFMLIALVSTILLINRDPIMGNYYRFFLHFIPLVFILCIPFWKSMIKDKIASWHFVPLVILLLLPVQITKLSADHQTYMIYAKGLSDAHVKLGKWINEVTPKNVTIAITDAGAVPFYAKRRTIDLWGLNNEYIAHKGFSSEYFWSEDPDIITLFSTTPGPFRFNYMSEYDIFESERFKQEFEFARIDSWQGSDYHLLTFTKKSLGLAPKSA